MLRSSILSLLMPERRAISITPRVVQRLGAGDETEQVYVVDVDLGKIALKKDVASLWKAAFGKSSEEALLNLQFLIEVPQKNFHLRKQFLQEYHAGTLAEARATGKVYAVDQLPSLMSDLVRTTPFPPAAAVSLDNRATSAALSHGLRLKVATPRRAFYLIFEDNKTAVTAAKTAAPQLRRR